MADDNQTRNAAETAVGPGTRLNDIFEIDEKIASGGMGEVFRGRNVITEEAVAIKIVLGKFSKDEMISSLFFKEARILSSLNDPAIVRYQIFTVDKAIGRPYLVMEYIDGISLAQRLTTSGPLSVPEVRLLTAKVAAGLQTAHAAGVIHRDMSPDNILLPNNNVSQPKIIDFGIARSTQPGNGTLLAGQFAGRENFASPEQFGLFGGRVEGASDVYSLALVVVNALQGVPLDMMGTQYDMIQKRMKVPDLSQVDAELRPILEEMLVPDPAARHLTMLDVANYFSEREPLSTLVRSMPVDQPVQAADADDFWQTGNTEPTPDAVATPDVTTPPTPVPAPGEATIISSATDDSRTRIKSASDTDSREETVIGGNETIIASRPREDAAFEAGPISSDARPIAWESLTVAPPPPESASIPSPRKRRTWPYALAASVVIVLAGGAGAAYLGALGPNLQQTLLTWFKGKSANVEVAVTDQSDATKTKPKPVAEEQTETKPKPVVREQTQAETEAKPKPVVEEQTQFETETKPKPVVEEQTQVENEAKPKPVVEEQTQAETESKPKPAVEEQTQVETEAKPKPVVEEQEQVETEAKPKPVVEEQTQVETETKPKPVVKEQAQVENEAKPKPVVEEQEQVETEARPKPVVEEQTQVETEAKPKPIVEEQTQVETEAKPKPVVEEQEQVETEAKPKPVVEEQAQVETEAKPKPVVEEQTQVETETKPKLVVEEQEQVETEAKPKPVVEEQTQVETEAKPKPIIKEQEQVETEAKSDQPTTGGNDSSNTEVANIPPVVVPPDPLAERASWLRDFSGEGCQFAQATENTTENIAILAASANLDWFGLLDEKFKSTFNLEAKITAKPIDPSQCGAVKFLGALRNQNIPELQLMLSPGGNVIEGKPVEGSVDGFNKAFNTLLLVSTDGAVYNLSKRAQSDGAGHLHFTLERVPGKSRGQTFRMLIVIGSDQRLDIAFPKGKSSVPLEKIIPELDKAILAQRDGIDYAYAFLRVDPKNK